MRPHSRRGGKRRRFTRKYGVFLLVAFCAVVAVAAVGFLTYMLTSMNWRWRY